MKTLSESNNIKPAAHNVTNIEEAVVFLYGIPNLYLRRDGKGRVSFVMPRSLLVSSQNQKARRFDQFKDIEFFEFNDMVFNIDCCCFFGTFTTDVPRRRDVFDKYPAPCKYFDADTMELLEEYELDPYAYFEPQRGEKYLIKKLIRPEKKDDLLPCSLSEYYTNFIQGADMIPKSLLLVKILDQTNNGRISIIDPWISPQAKGFWKQKHFSRERVESENLFKVTLSRGLYPYYIELYNIFLPFNKNFEYAPENIGPYSRKHWKNIKRIYKKENDNDLYEVGINYRNKLCKNGKVRKEQRKLFKIMFPNAKSLMSAVIKDPKGEKFVDSTLYYYGTDNEDEAYYLCGMFNIRKLYKSTKTVSDTRLHHKRPLYFHIPKFADTSEQKEIARLSKICSQKVEDMANSGEKLKISTIRTLIKEEHQKIRGLGLKILNNGEGINIIKEYLIE